VAANLERDLAAARLTQQSLTPQKSPALPAVRGRGLSTGDPGRRRHLRMAAHGRWAHAFWIADATGHGASAALLTTLAKLLFQHGSVEHNKRLRSCAAVNKRFPQHLRRALVMTGDVRGARSGDRPRHGRRCGSSAADRRAGWRNNGIDSVIGAAARTGGALGFRRDRCGCRAR
jgi:hypothetical protein